MENFQDRGVWIRIRSWKNHRSGSGSGLFLEVGSGSGLEKIMDPDSVFLRRDPNPVCPESPDPDPVCTESLDPVNIRPDPKPW